MKKHQPKKSIETAQSVTTPQQQNRSLNRILAFTCAVFAFMLYSGTFQHGFTVDDDTVMAKNKIVTKGASAIPEIFSTAYRKGFWDRNESLYRPLTLVMFAVEWQLSGGKPWLGHVINVLLYAVTGLVLYNTLRQLFKNRNIIFPFLITLLYIAHPLHTEVVSNIKSRDEILCFLFSISAINFFLQYLNSNKVQHVLAGALMLFLAMLSKENAITFVVVAPLTLFFFTKADKKTLINVTAFTVGATALYFTIRMAVLKGATNFGEIQLVNNSLIGAEGDFAKRLASALYINGKYLLLLIFPHPLSFDYSYNSIPLVSFGDIRALIPLLVITALAVYAIKNFSKKDPVVYGILFYALTIVLVCNLFLLIEATLAERFAYMPVLGFCIALPFFLSKYLKHDVAKSNYSSLPAMLKANSKLSSVIIVIILLFSVKSFSRSRDWVDNYTLLKTDVQSMPESARIRYAYGSELVIAKAFNEKDKVLKEKYLNDGIEQLEKGVSILSSYSDAWFNLGMAYKEKKDDKNAIRCFEEVRKQKKNKDFDFYIAIGIAYGEDKQYDKALADLKTATDMKPESDEAWNNYGLYLTEAGRIEDAINALNTSIKLNKDNEQAIYNLGNTYARVGDFNKAVDYYQQAIKIDAGYTDAWNNLGNSYGAMKDYKNALNAYKKLSEMDPTNSKAVHNMAVTYYMLGDSVNANVYMQRAEQLRTQGF